MAIIRRGCSHYSMTRKRKSGLEGEGSLRVVGLGPEDIQITEGYSLAGV